MSDETRDETIRRLTLLLHVWESAAEQTLAAARESLEAMGSGDVQLFKAAQDMFEACKTRQTQAEWNFWFLACDVGLTKAEVARHG
jgi:hypothetical protein